MLRVCLSHDIDRVVKSHQYITRSLRSLISGDWRGVYKQIKSLSDKHPYWGFDHLVEIEDSLNVRSTIFFLNESIRLKPWDLSTYQLALGRYSIKSEKITDLIKYLDRNGWEIGVHGSYNSFNNINLLKYEKNSLEQILGHQVRGIRQHYLNLNDMTWALQSEAGFSYDSSFGYTDNIGFKDNRIAPFHPFSDGFVVFPLTIMDMCFVNYPDKWSAFERIASECEENGAVLVVNFHQHVFHEPDFPGWGDDYIGIIQRCKARNAEFKTMGQWYDDLLDHPRERDTCVDTSSGDWTG
jgi:hypothetical protein